MKRSVFVRVGVMSCAAAISARGQQYRYVEVPLLPGAQYGEGFGVNDFGQSVGRCGFAGAIAQSWMYDSATGVVTALPLGNHRQGNGAFAINNAGDVAGTIETAGFNTAFVYAAGTVSPLTRNITDLDNELSFAFAINQGGEVSGRHSFQCSAGVAPQEGALWASGTANPQQVITATNCGLAEARGINDDGWTCGVGQVSFTSPAQTWSRPARSDGLAMSLLPSINASGRENAYANDINNSNIACGYSEDRSVTPTLSRPCTWNGEGAITVLGGASGTEARSINDDSEIVGVAPAGAGGATIAVIWPAFSTAAPIDLNTTLTAALPAQTQLARAESVSNTGFISGRVDLPGGTSRGFVLEPCTPGFITVPEPREVECNAPVTLTCLAAGAGPLVYEWKRGEVVVGSGSTLTIPAFSSTDNGDYTCVVTTACGSLSTPAVSVTLVCPADFDRSGGTPDAQDIDAFFTQWLAGDPSADTDCSGGTPDAQDIDVFFAAWLAGGCSF